MMSIVQIDWQRRRPLACHERAHCSCAGRRRAADLACLTLTVAMSTVSSVRPGSWRTSAAGAGRQPGRRTCDGLLALEFMFAGSLAHWLAGSLARCSLLALLLLLSVPPTDWRPLSARLGSPPLGRLSTCRLCCLSAGWRRRQLARRIQSFICEGERATISAPIGHWLARRLRSAGTTGTLDVSLARWLAGAGRAFPADHFRWTRRLPEIG